MIIVTPPHLCRQCTLLLHPQFLHVKPIDVHTLHAHVHAAGHVATFTYQNSKFSLTKFSWSEVKSWNSQKYCARNFLEVTLAWMYAAAVHTSYHNSWIYEHVNIAETACPAVYMHTEYLLSILLVSPLLSLSLSLSLSLPLPPSPPPSLFCSWNAGSWRSRG